MATITADDPDRLPTEAAPEFASIRYERALSESLADPAARHSMHASWGFCGRHSRSLLSVEARSESRLGFLSALVYVDLLEQALTALTVHGPLAGFHARSSLRSRGQCPLCVTGVEPDTESLTSGETGLVPNPALSAAFGALVAESRPYWLPFACPKCLRTGKGTLCREHLRTTLPGASLPEARASLGALARSLIAYSRSFLEGGARRATAEERAGLMAAVGWCVGWREILAASYGHEAGDGSW
jgi:hypothetical protein